MIKTTGAEFKRFYSDKEFWPEGIIHDDEEVTVDGVMWDGSQDYMTMRDDARVTVAYGCVSKEVVCGEDGEVASFEGYFRKWRRLQAVTFLAVEVPNDKVEAVKAAIKAAGGKVR